MRLFVAVLPDAAVREVLAALVRPEPAGVRWTPPDTWHVTLRFLGEVASAVPVASALHSVDLGGPVTVRFGPATERLGRDVLVVPAAGLDEVAARVGAATAHLGTPPDRPGFRGHLTIARRRRRGGRLPAGETAAATGTVTEVAIVHSHLGPGGARHEIVSRISL